MPLSQSEIARYSRHLALREIGTAGQEKLKAAKVLVIGAGGLGSPSILYLAAAGIGTIGIVDFDKVDVSNLQRQVLFDTAGIGKPKAERARDRLAGLNPQIRVIAHAVELRAANALEIFSKYDVVLDGTDRFATRYLTNDACVLLKKPLISAAIHRFEGQAMTYVPNRGPCYRCLFPEPPTEGLVPNCAEAGVLGVLPGVLGTIQATEAIKLILGAGDPLIGRFLVYDALRMRFRELKLPKDPDCAVCGTNPTITALREYGGYCAPAVVAMTATELKARIDAGTAPVILDVREPSEHAESRIEGSILIPLGELPHRLEELDPSREIVVHCKSGGRSAHAVALLRQKGFDRSVNLTGGITSWLSELAGQRQGR